MDVDAGEDGDVGPSQDGDVGDGELAAARADDVVAVLQAGIEYAVETLRLADVPLDAIGDLLLGEAEEVVRLALPMRGRGELVLVRA